MFPSVDGFDGDELKEECGVIGIHAPDHEAARLAFFALYTLQHRGQEAAGMASVDGGVAHVHKGQGLVPAVFNEENLSTLKGEFAIGHTRYSTTGGTGLRNAQPHVIETIDGPLGLAHNGNLVNAHVLRRQLLERGVGLVRHGPGDRRLAYAPHTGQPDDRSLCPGLADTFQPTWAFNHDSILYI